MAQFEVFLTKTITYTASVEIEAPNDTAALAQAKALVANGEALEEALDTQNVAWTWGDETVAIAAKGMRRL